MLHINKKFKVFTGFRFKEYLCAVRIKAAENYLIETEKSITDTILKLKGQITIIAVAHRLTTLAQCDFKVKFENGKAFIIK